MLLSEGKGARKKKKRVDRVSEKKKKKIYDSRLFSELYFKFQVFMSFYPPKFSLIMAHVSLGSLLMLLVLERRFLLLFHIRLSI